MLKEIAQEARDNMSGSDGLWKSYKLYSGGNELNTICVGLSIVNAADGHIADLDDRFKVKTRLFKSFLAANNIPVEQADTLGTIYQWNDRPETTHAGAVAALDRLVDYLGTQEGE